MLTAQDIQAQQFHVRFRGFDVEEVDEFLERIAEAYLALSEENKKLKTQADALEKDLATYKNQEKTFQNVILSAQGLAEEMKEKSRKEAEELLANAREEAQNLQQNANIEITDLEKELDRLKGLKEEIHAELRQMLQTYLDQLEKGQAAMPSQAEAVFNSVEPRAAAEEDDLAELYQKIDLTDDMTPEVEAEAETLPVQPLLDSELLDMEEEELPTIPDLDGDMTFSLEDPLDEQEPAVDLGSVLDEDEPKK